jgi:hypothetical protein
VSRSDKFAPMTSSLLARKGEAGPSLGPLKHNPGWPDWRDMAPPPRPPFAALAAVPEYARPLEYRVGEGHGRNHANGHDDEHDHEHRRKIVLKLSREEHERLGIAAVKKGLTSHQLVRAALDAYIEALIREYGKGCACIAGSCSRRCE